MRKTDHVRLRLGIDTGGTFTDFVAVCGRRRWAFKLPSTPDDPARAILAGIARLLADVHADPHADDGDELGRGAISLDIVHGTTVGTNALLERRGARTALLTTAGFEDVIEIGRQARPDLYNLAVRRAAPLVPRELRFGLRERIGPDGAIITPLETEDLAPLIKRLRRARVEAVAISLLFSFAYPGHERAVREALAGLEVPISVSHEILPEYREYERTSTVVINAYLAPRVGRYLTTLEGGLAELAAGRASLRVMQSSGGSVSAATAAREPVRTILSGPAGGVVAAARRAARAGLSDVITFDMGGTSTDVALFRGAARTTNEAQLTGLPVAVPVLDIHTVGAGGGSIAYLDAGGALRVGPESAGADPGPACYGKGMLPTVTDANLVLGRLGRGGLLAGAMPLDVGRANEALDRLAIALSRFATRRVTREAAALGLIRVANANMERALRLVSIERGQDPRLFTLISFGGAGGLHAAALAAALRIPRVIVPADPGNFSALGVLLADVSKDYSRTVMREVTPGLEVELARQFSALERQASRDLRDEGFDAARRKFLRRLAMRYRGQSFELEVDWRRDFVAAFHRAHRERYGQSDPSRPVEVVSVRLRAVGITEKPSLRRAREVRRGRARPSDRTFIWTETGRVRAAVYDRDSLEAGLRLEAPAIVTEYGATTFIPPGWSCRIDRDANLLLDSAHGLT